MTQRLFITQDLVLETRNRPSLVGVTVKPVRQNQQRRRPQTDKNAKSLGMSLLFGFFAVEKPPDPDRKKNGQDSRLKAKVAEGSTDARVHFFAKLQNPVSKKQVINNTRNLMHKKRRSPKWA